MSRYMESLSVILLCIHKIDHAQILPKNTAENKKRERGRWQQKPVAN